MIKISAVPSTLWRKNSVGNVDDCNYELYLTEFVNTSEKFKQITGKKEVVYCNSQSNGEWDCAVDGKPFLDFKLLCSQKMQQDIGETDLRLIANEHGTYDVKRPELKNQSYYGYWIHALLSSLTVDDLQDIYNGSGKLTNLKANKDLLSILKVASVDKDCLFLYTEFFMADEEITLEQMTEGAIKFLNRWVPTLFKFRDNTIPNRKTYLAFMVPKFKKIVICIWNGQDIELFDAVSFDKSQNFMKYSRITPYNKFTKELFGG